MTSQASSRFAVQINDAPAWFTSMADKTWAAIAGGAAYGSAYQNGATISNLVNTLPYTGNTGWNAIIASWTAGCASQSLRELYLPAQGGHADLYNTCVLALDLGSSVPQWKLLWNLAANNLNSSELGYNPAAFGHADGSPRCQHGWFHAFCDNNNRIWLTMVNNNPSGDWGTNCYSISRTRPWENWTYHGRLYPSIPGGSPGSTFSWQSGAGAFYAAGGTRGKILKRADFYVGNGVCVLDCATTLSAGPQDYAAGAQTAGCTFYENRDVTGVAPAPSCVTTGTVAPCWIDLIAGVPEVFDLSAPGNFATLSASGTVQQPAGAGAVWHQASNAVLVYDIGLGANIGKLGLSTTDPRSASYAWSSVAAAAGNTIVPATDQGSYQGAFSKFQIITDMGAPEHKSALVIASNYAGPTYVYKLPTAGV